MTESRQPALEERVARLERMIEEIHRALGASAAAPGIGEAPWDQFAGEPAGPAGEPLPATSDGPATAPVRAAPDATAAADRITHTADGDPPGAYRSPPGADWSDRGESWLAKAGIGLVFLGLAYLFHYSVSQGWITPPVRVAIGFMLGCVLLSAGLRLGNVRRRYSEILLGGALATFYIVGYAAFHLYALAGQAVAFAFMVLVTALGFHLARRHDQATLAVIGVAGGLATPFLLESAPGGIPALVAYTCLLLALTAAVYLERGWRTLLWTAVVGGWIVLGIAVDAATDRNLAVGERWVVQAGILFGWLVLGLLPLVREALRARGPTPDRWPLAPVNAIGRLTGWDEERTERIQAQVLAFGSAAVGIGLIDYLWSLSEEAVGVLFVAAAVPCFALAWVLRHSAPNVVSAGAHAAALLLVSATTVAIDGSALVAALAAEGFALQQVARRAGIPGLRRVGHGTFALVAALLLTRYADPVSADDAAFSGRAFADFAAIALAFLASFQLPKGLGTKVYRLAAHIALLAFLWHELGAFEHGQGFITIAWGCYGALLMVLAIRRGDRRLQPVALATLGLVVLKLLIVDTASVENLWRILLFLGFGLAFLLLSYYLKAALPAPDRAVPGDG